MRRRYTQQQPQTPHVARSSLPGKNTIWVASQPNIVRGPGGIRAADWVGTGYQISRGSGGASLLVGTQSFVAGGVNLGDPDELLGSTEATIAVYRRCTSTSNATKYLFGYDLGSTDRALAAAAWTDGNLYWDYGNATSGSGRLSFAYTRDTSPETLVFVAGSGVGREVWRRGVRIANDAAATASRSATSATQFVLGHSLASGGNDTEEIYLCIVSDRAWTARQIQAWCANPYGETFAAIQRRIWVPVSVAGGVTGTLAYTNANDTSSASGTTTVTGTLAKTNANDTSAASGSPTVNGSLATTNANDTLAASGSAGSDVTGTVAYTNANDTAAASGTPTVTGTSATTNAADTSAAAGTTTVVGTSATTNADDTAAASGVSGAITGTVDYTNADDTLFASGSGGAVQTTTGVPGGARFRRLPYVVFIDGKRYIGTEDEIRALIEEVAERQAEKAIVQAKAPKKPRIVVEPGKTVQGRVFKEQEPEPQVAQRAISVQADMRRLYAEVYARIIAELEEEEEEALISLL